VLGRIDMMNIRRRNQLVIADLAAAGNLLQAAAQCRHHIVM